MVKSTGYLPEDAGSTPHTHMAVLNYLLTPVPGNPKQPLACTGTSCTHDAQSTDTYVGKTPTCTKIVFKRYSEVGRLSKGVYRPWHHIGVVRKFSSLIFNTMCYCCSSFEVSCISRLTFLQLTI